MAIVYGDPADGTSAINNINAATVLKKGAGRLIRVSVTTAGSAAGAMYDDTSTTPAAANIIGGVPNTVGIYEYRWPVVNGIVYVPGTGQVASVSFS